MNELIEDYTTYRECGGILTFRGWLKHHHYDLYLKIYGI